MKVKGLFDNDEEKMIKELSKYLQQKRKPKLGDSAGTGFFRVVFEGEKDDLVVYRIIGYVSQWKKGIK